MDLACTHTDIYLMVKNPFIIIAWLIWFNTHNSHVMIVSVREINKL
jgi:hypothetical protein